jgi:N6-adenosine-specific RNA methylase IME4
MSIEELCRYPVKNLAADNAVLFLWVTVPFLDECWPVITSWGFEYKASFVWDKVLHNYGHYNSVRHELLLVCARGKFLPESNELIDSVITIERSDEHSEKPEEFRKLIDELYPTGNRIELFARDVPPKPWKSWGDECSASSQHGS